MPRIEDQIISRTWRYYVEGIVDDPDVVLPVAMVKVRELTSILYIGQMCESL